MVPKLRFKEFCGEWEEKRLGDICKINPKNESLPDTFNYIDLENVVDGRLLKFNNTISKNNAPSRAKRLLQNNDILYQTVRPYQKNNFYFDIEETEIPYVASTGYAQLRTDKNNPKFIFQEIHTDIFVNNVLERCTGTSYPAINSSDLGNIRFTIPSLSEQTKIADFLSTVDDKIQNQQDKITHFENIKKGFMQKIFSRKIRFKDDGREVFPEWEETELKNKVDIIMGQSPSSDSYNEEKIGVPLVQGNADIKNRMTFPIRYTNKPTKICKKGSLIMTVRAPVGYIGKANQEVCIGRGVCEIQVKKCNSEYIYQFLMSKEDSWDKISQGSTFTSISSNDIKKLKIHIPPLPEQTKIADFLSSFDEKISKEKDIQEHLKEIKKGLLQQMFV